MYLFYIKYIYLIGYIIKIYFRYVIFNTKYTKNLILYTLNEIDFEYDIEIDIGNILSHSTKCTPGN